MSWIHTLLNLLFPPPVPLSGFHALPAAKPHDHYPWIFAATRYTGDARKIAKYIKSTPDKLYVHACASKMAFVLESYLLETAQFQNPSIYLVPVPQHTSRTQDRGFSQSALLAAHIAEILPYTDSSEILVKIRKTEKQALLPKKLRIKNQQNAFGCIPNLENINKNSLIVIIDDISTTGSTLLACKTALQERGFNNIIGLTFAH